MYTYVDFSFLILHINVYIDLLFAIYCIIKYTFVKNMYTLIHLSWLLIRDVTPAAPNI